MILVSIVIEMSDRCHFLGSYLPLSRCDNSRLDTLDIYEYIILLYGKDVARALTCLSISATFRMRYTSSFCASYNRADIT